MLLLFLRKQKTLKMQMFSNITIPSVPRVEHSLMETVGLRGCSTVLGLEGRRLVSVLGFISVQHIGQVLASL